MAWTAYHDQLQQEAISLMAEPEWYDQTTIVYRLYGREQGSTESNPSPTSIMGQLKAAGATLGNVPKLDASGKIIRDGQGKIVYISGDEQYAELMSQFEKGRLEADAANEQRYDQLLSGYKNRADTVLGGVTRNAEGNVTGGVPSYKSVGQEYGAGLDSVSSGYQSREADVMSNFNQYGAQARTDITNNYTQQKATADQDLTNRGLGNTTVRSSTMAGLNSNQTQDLGRFDQDLSRQRADLLGGLRGDTLAAKTAAAQGKAQFGTQYLGAASSLLEEPLGVIERRTDTGPSLADISNLSSQAGRGAASSYVLPNFGSVTSYQPKSAAGSTF